MRWGHADYFPVGDSPSWLCPLYYPYLPFRDIHGFFQLQCLSSPQKNCNTASVGIALSPGINFCQRWLSALNATKKVSSHCGGKINGDQCCAFVSVVFGKQCNMIYVSQ